MTPNELARELAVPQLQLRVWLRDTYPRPATAKWSRWELSREQIDVARAHFAERKAQREERGRRRAESAEWFWEGHVQARIVEYLAGEGWTIESAADTGIKEQGDDVRASKDGRILRVEVKGWPSTTYSDPGRANEVKRTQPTTQAGIWFAEGLLHVIRDLGRFPKDAVALGLPDRPRYRSLVEDTKPVLHQLRIGLLFVREDGSIEEALPARS